MQITSFVIPANPDRRPLQVAVKRYHFRAEIPSNQPGIILLLVHGVGFSSSGYVIGKWMHTNPIYPLSQTKRYGNLSLKNSRTCNEFQAAPSMLKKLGHSTVPIMVNRACWTKMSSLATQRTSVRILFNDVINEFVSSCDCRFRRVCPCRFARTWIGPYREPRPTTSSCYRSFRRDTSSVCSPSFTLPINRTCLSVWLTSMYHQENNKAADLCIMIEPPSEAFGPLPITKQNSILFLEVTKNRRDIWPSKKEALEWFAARRPWKTWDRRALEAYVVCWSDH